MFGFLSPGCRDVRYRQVYAAYCAYQRHEYGVLSSPFTSYEAIFLYLVAVEMGAAEPTSSCTPTCCRFRSDSTNRWNLDELAWTSIRQSLLDSCCLSQSQLSENPTAMTSQKNTLRQK